MSNSETSGVHPAPLSPWTTAAYFVAGNLLPSLAVLVSVTSYGGPAWQSGQFHEFAWFLFTGPAAGLFCPFLLYSVACFTLALLKPAVVARHFAARLGLYSGVVLALHACIVSGIVVLQLGDLSSPYAVITVAIAIPLTCIALALAIPALWRIGAAVRRRLANAAQKQGVVAVLMVAPPALAVCVGLGINDQAIGFLFALLVIAPGSFIFGLFPCSFLAAYIAMSVRIGRMQVASFQFRTWHVLAVMTWLAAYLAAWRFAVKSAVKAYAALPVDPPNNACYIATAAAAGHPRLVGSYQIVTASGAVVRVNSQLVTLKCGELVLLQSLPRVHHVLRRIYDRVGPPLAYRMRNPWVADIAYLTLKPLEWMTRLFLTVVLAFRFKLANPDRES